MSRYGQIADEGATFFDPEGKRTGLIWFSEAEIRDGQNHIAGRRLFAVYQGIGNGTQGLSFVSPAILWDLKPLNEKEHTQITEPEEAVADTDTIISFIIRDGVEKYRGELLERRQRDAEIKRKYGIRSLDSMILDSDAKISDYETRRMKGETIPEATIQNEVRRKEDLERKRERLTKEVEAEIHLYPTEPKIIGAVRVLPRKTTDDMVADEEVEQIGMKVTMEYEKKSGRIPKDIHLENLGYDIRSTDQAGNYRYIEVKARAKEGAIALTPNEWLMAQRLKEEYWLYAIMNAAKRPEIYLIQNPAMHLKPKKEISIVRYIVKDWKDKSERAK
jgi:hypothetical protein